MPNSDKQRRAYSYARFSTSEQSDGYSLQCQLKAAKSYCERHGLTLDEHTFNDEGVSAFRGGNATGGQLAAFIELVKAGRIPRGSVLIVENTDRLSRLPPDEATRIICDIVKAGIDIVTTSPEQVYTAANINKLATWLPLQVQQCLARDESEKKSDRLKDAWARKRGELADDVKLSKTAPFWLKLSADRTDWIVLDHKVAMVRRIFELSLEGMGVSKISGVMHQEFPEGAKGKGWQPNVIRAILRNRAAIGEFQPHTGTCAKKGGIKSTRRPHGEPLKNYFPAIIEEADFWCVQAGMDARKRGGGRITGTPNLFNGYLHDAHDGERMVINAVHGKKVLVSAGAVRKVAGSVFRAIPYEEFENAILDKLNELRASDVTKKNGSQDELQAASDALTAANHKFDKMNDRAAKSDDPEVFADLIETLAHERKAAKARFEAAQGKAAMQAGDQLGDFRSLRRLLAEASDEERPELRRRIRGTMQRFIADMRALPVRRNHVLLVAVQAWFRESGKHRDFILAYESASRNRPGGWWCRSLNDVVALGELDIRDGVHAIRLEKALNAIDLESLLAAMTDPK
jgi:DNA invertase Pin-like site-specific DNA recombinase